MMKSRYALLPGIWSLCLSLCLSLCITPAFGAPALSAPMQAELDGALQAYASGRLGAARAAFESLARRDVAAARYNLAVMHLRREVPRPDLKRARRLLEQAASSGFVTAQMALGRALESGELGPRELVAAHDYYELAAQAGNTEAQVAMGTAYYLGRGRPKDAAQAASWYREAAKAGDVGAQYLLASMYEQGDGLETDLRLARYWYEAAARNGDLAAPGKLREIDSRLARSPS
jgi:TPR repeat protein